MLVVDSHVLRGGVLSSKEGKYYLIKQPDLVA